MLIRVARQQKKRIPILSGGEVDSENAREVGSKRAPGAPRAAAGGHKRAAEKERTNKFGRLGLRDWSDVLGAAALAGFSADVISRATQRCADLFEEGMCIHNLAEIHAASGKTDMASKRYAPGQPLPPEPGDYESHAAEQEQSRTVFRPSSLMLDRPSSSSAEEKNEKHRRRSLSVISTYQLAYCPHPGCSRALDGFTRWANLERHLLLVHGKSPGLVIEDGDSADELYGAVHVDGFLKPIKARKGWRGADTQKGGRRRRRPKRAAGSGADEDNESELDEGDVKPGPEESSDSSH
jgi:hypothetical protein